MKISFLYTAIATATLIPVSSAFSTASYGLPLRTTFNTQLQVSTEAETDLGAFADSLEDEDSEAFLFENNEDDSMVQTWQESLDMLLDVNTPMAKRTILLSDLVSSNDSIRESLQEAVASRKIDPILTPTGKKLQDGTRAVARQITNDILPSIADMANNSDKVNTIVNELPSLVPKVGERVLDAVRTNAKKNLEILQGDLADPRRIPERLSKQRADIEAEVRNIFLDTPENLNEPKYKVIEEGVGYEIREYEGYTAAATSMSKAGEQFNLDDITSGGAAFNALAAYLFGANTEEKGMEMTVPVTTTSAGEMRFYLKKDGMEVFPIPLAVEDTINEKGAVKVIDVPPSRVAVARFTGFVTGGEVARQKDVLLNALATDGVEIDVPHGAVVPFLVFQYNPPYTLPIVRRNEIAVPVLAPGEVPAALEEEWSSEKSEQEEDNSVDEYQSDVEAPSDVE